jgi:hypothetical protein
MKQLILLIIICVQFVNLTNAQNNTPANECGDLFISEITFGKVPNASNMNDLNYAIEIFNPTLSAINLSNYTLELTSSSNTVTTILLQGTLNSHDVIVLCNNNADLNLQGLADLIYAGLNFENNVVLELKHGNAVIDRIGQTGASTLGAIDFVQLLADPYTYLQTFHIDLNDYKNIDIRRSMFVNQGNPTFNSASDILGTWSYHLNTDRTNIGAHLCVCNKPLGTTIIGFQQSQPLHTDVYNCGGAPAGPVGDYFVINHNGNDPGVIEFTETAGGTATVTGYNNSGDLEWNLCANCTNSTSFNTPDGSNSVNEGVNANGSYTFDKTAAFLLTSPTSNYIVDAANEIHWTWLKACWPTAIKEFSIKNDIEIYPTVSSNTINIKTKDKYSFELISTNGQTVKRGIIDTDNYVLDITNLVNSPYFILFYNDKGQKFYNTIIKN